MRPIRFLAPAAIVLAGLLAYSSAFPGAFVFDDAPNISRNPQLDRPLDYLPGGPGYSAQPGRAVTFATFALDRAVAGNAPTFHRAVNVAIHILGALLVLALTMAAFQAPRLRGSALAPQAWAVGLVAGLLFVAHPIQTQAVTYIVQRLASLATLFYLLAALLYVSWRNAGEAGSRGWAARSAYAGALVAAMLAMRSKEIAFTLPAALLLLEAAPYFEKAIALRRVYPDAYANLAACWNGLGRYADAVRLLEGARDLIRKQPLARAQLALALAQLGDLSAARREVEAIRPLAPGIAAQLQGYLDTSTREKP